ncbi:hypothetical protein BHE74_00057359, partial [Ensete ventricosum]
KIARKGGSRTWPSHLQGWLATVGPPAKGRATVTKAPCKGAADFGKGPSAREASGGRPWPRTVAARRLPQGQPPMGKEMARAEQHPRVCRPGHRVRRRRPCKGSDGDADGARGVRASFLKRTILPL